MWALWILAFAWFGMYGIAPELGRRHEARWPWSLTFLFASIAWGATVVAITELLSLFGAIRRDALLISWIAACLAAVGLYLGLRAQRAGWGLPHFPCGLPETDPLVVSMAVSGGACANLALLGLAYAPNNFDSMTCHLSRVMHWQQNPGIMHYPTHIDRQIQMSPYAEFVILHVNTLSRSDRWANMVQWFAIVGCAIGVAQIARGLGVLGIGDAVAGLGGPDRARTRRLQAWADVGSSALDRNP